MSESFSDTKLSLTLGGITYNLYFGIFTRRRIAEAQPDFDIFSSKMQDFEIIPFLIQCAIEPEDRKWKDEKEFIALYEACTDEESLSKVPLAYQNSLGFTNRRFEPLIKRLADTVKESQKAEK
jgi:hypothetical protein